MPRDGLGVQLWCQLRPAMLAAEADSLAPMARAAGELARAVHGARAVQLPDTDPGTGHIDSYPAPYVEGGTPTTPEAELALRLQRRLAQARESARLARLGEERAAYEAWATLPGTVDGGHTWGSKAELGAARARPDLIASQVCSKAPEAGQYQVTPGQLLSAGHLPQVQAIPLPSGGVALVESGVSGGRGLAPTLESRVVGKLRPNGQPRTRGKRGGKR